jgi:HAD superfamily hydrolase (TIGR01509 family)
VEALPGVVPWLESLLAAGIPCGIGSSTARANIDLSLELIGCKRYFSTIVSAEDVTLGKPDPSIFLLVASRLGMAPGKCVVFEDALFGIEAARRAGMKCVAVATTFPAEQLTKDTNRVVHRLDELAVGELASWF